LAGATGVAGLEALEAAPIPLLFVAFTVQVYGVPLVRLVTTMGLVAPVIVLLPQVAE
jgi:hypothetical protein